MNITEFHTLAKIEIEYIANRLEEQDKNYQLDIDFDHEILYITLPDDGQYVINQHVPTMQIWLSSPISGAAHFTYNQELNLWVATNDKKSLRDVIFTELSNFINMEL